MRCPMCGHVLGEEAQERACRGCPLRVLTKGCRLGLLRCPVCRYHSLSREFQRNPEQNVPSKRPKPKEATRIPTPKVTTTKDLGNKTKISLGELPPGAEARLLGFDGLREPEVRRLLAYGLVPGVRVRLLQRSPAVVLKAGETELALEVELAHSIEVVPSPASTQRWGKMSARSRSRKRWGRGLILLGVAVWVPYAALKYLAHNEVSLTPFLTLHLLGVIPGALLVRSEELSARLRRARSRRWGKARTRFREHLLQKSLSRLLPLPDAVGESDPPIGRAREKDP